MVTLRFHDPTWRHDSFPASFPCHMFHYFTKITQMRFHRRNPPIINRLTGFQILGNVPSCHTLLHRSKNASDALSPTWSDLTFFIILDQIYPFWTSGKEVFIADSKHYKPSFLVASHRLLTYSQEFVVEPVNKNRCFVFVEANFA